jgi:RNA polymerase sigma-70 factor (ECF subfamily)
MATRQIDHGIVRLAQGGDVASFEMILSLYQRSVYNFALRQVRNREDAEDVTQDVFIKLFKNIKRFNFKNKFSTWLFAIAQNLVNDFFRKKKRRREVLIIDNQDAKSEWLLNRFANTSFGRC